MSTPEERPNPDEALARARATRKQMAAMLDEDQDPEGVLLGRRDRNTPASAGRMRPTFTARPARSEHPRVGEYTRQLSGSPSFHGAPRVGSETVRAYSSRY